VVRNASGQVERRGSRYDRKVPGIRGAAAVTAEFTLRAVSCPASLEAGMLVVLAQISFSPSCSRLRAGSGASTRIEHHPQTANL